MQVTLKTMPRITLNGMETLGTAGVFADMFWAGNLLELGRK